MRVAVCTVSLLLGVSIAFAGAPFQFNGAAARAVVTTSEEADGIKLRREFTLTMAPEDDGWVVAPGPSRVLSASGGATTEQVQQAFDLVRPTFRPMYLDHAGRAISLHRVDEDTLTELRGRLPGDGPVRTLAAPRLDRDDLTVADEAQMHQWNAFSGYWVGRDRSMAKPLRAKLEDGRIARLEHLGPVAKPVGAHHLSVVVQGERPGTVRGCTDADLASVKDVVNGGDTAELVHILDRVVCELTETVEAVVDPDTLRPHLVVSQSTLTLLLPGRAAVDRTSTARFDYVWTVAKKKR